MTIEETFAEVYRIRPQKNEDRQQYLDRVVERVNETSDDDWERLTEEAQQWFNKAVKPWAARKDIPDFPDAEQEQEDDEENHSELPEESEDTMASKTKTKKRATGKKKVASTKSASGAVRKKKVSGTAPKVQTGVLGPSGASVIKRAMLRNMRATPEELQKALRKEGRELSPVRLALVRSDFRHSIRLLQEEGKLKDKYIV